MAAAEDAATVLEQFVHDVANLPAEVAHLLEEIQAKDHLIQECRQVINNRDSSLQKHIKQMGAHVKHPKEEQVAKIVSTQYDKAQALQYDKVALIQKASFLLDRQVKRLDLKIQELVNEGSLVIDGQMPSLLHDSPANLVPPASTTSTGVNTPLSTLAISAGSSANVANAAMARMANTAAQATRIIPQAPIAGMQPHPLISATSVGQKVREPSAGAATDSKRRRLNVNIGSLPNPSSNLGRQSSLGPGTPKPGTPMGSRAGSTGPRVKKTTKKLAPHQQNMRKKLSKGGLSKKSARRLMGGARASPSTTGEDNSEGSGSDEDNDSSAPGHDGAADEEVEGGGEENEGEDDKLYCTCQTVSHGDMVACDNLNCAYEWFHWECVGLTREPSGTWICPECKKLPLSQVKLQSSK